jgi:omega-6 fatty acid desaturase (delta-12 desaturase)
MSEATATLGVATGNVRSERPFWKESLAPYARPHLGHSTADILTSVLPYLALSAGMYFLLDVSYLLTLLVAVPAAGFLLRTYIVFHDCAHGSFLKSKTGNLWLGRVVALLVYTPFSSWRHSHAVHHATSGDLDRRGVGDVPTLTVAEYNSMSRGKRIGYWLFRNPLVMFGIGPIWALIVQPRMVKRSERARIRHSVHLTNVAIVAMVALMCWAIGWQAFVLVQLPTAWLAGAAGVFLFYVQHQFEDAYWENTGTWSYAEAALRGSSYLKLPKVLQYFTGNIGLHHVHHLSARIPNYYLQRAHDSNEIFDSVPVLTLWDGMKAVRLKLWDEETGRLVTFKQARAERGRPQPRAGTQPAGNAPTGTSPA